MAFDDFKLFLPPAKGGQETSLQVFSSVKGIILAEAHFVPLFVASASFPLTRFTLWTLRTWTLSIVKVKLFLLFLWNPSLGRTLSYFWCLLRSWQSNQSTTPTAPPCSQLKTREVKPQDRTISDLPGGLQTTWQTSVSASSIIRSFAHCSPLFVASAMISLWKELSMFKFWNCPFLVLFLLPQPQVAEQDVQPPQGPTSQSTGNLKGGLTRFRRYTNVQTLQEYCKCCPMSGPNDCLEHLFFVFTAGPLVRVFYDPDVANTKKCHESTNIWDNRWYKKN